jgi:hypothetical protein
MVTEKKKGKLFISGIPPLIHFYLWQIVYHLANPFNPAFQFISVKFVTFRQCVWGVWVWVLKGLMSCVFHLFLGHFATVYLDSYELRVFHLFGIFSTV